MKNYTLKTSEDKEEKKPLKEVFSKMIVLMADEKKSLIWAFVAILLNSFFTLIGPLMVGYTIDHYIVTKQYHGLFVFGGLLLVVYVAAFISNYLQIRIMGAAAQRVLFKIRNAVFSRLQELPVSFFNQNKSGDLISRINNDTNKLNEFFGSSLMQFAGNALIITGAAIFILSINWRLGGAALVPALFLLVLTQTLSFWIKTTNLRSLQAEGALSGEVQESLTNFKVILAFNRRDYFRKKFEKTNNVNFKTSVVAGLANGIYGPVFDFANNIAQLIVLVYGIYLIIHGSIAIGILIGFLLYVSRFYDPLRSFASLLSTFQIALAAWDRISEILHLESDLAVLPSEKIANDHSIMRFEKVSFGYPNGRTVLRDINFTMEKGKTYALVGPTGGGKTTTASIIARLYDPSEGAVFLDGKDIRAYTAKERTKKIGFILQEPFLFTGTVRDNILYGNEEFKDYTNEQIEKVINDAGLEKLLARFDQGLETPVQSSSDVLSLGQKQLIAFIRAVLRNPDLLILDEATANIDTVTEQLLEEILAKLPKETTRVIIAHRLNTIAAADEIFFVNGGEITAAGSMEHAVEMLLHGKRQS